MTMLKSHSVTPSTIRNGIDIAALQGCIDGVAARPAEGQTTWRMLSTWKGGTRSDHQVGECTIGSASVPREFVIRTDEPEQLCGTNRYANPQDHLLAALNACMMVGYAALAAHMGITLSKLEVETTGDIDLRGFLGLDPAVPAGYPALKQVVRIAGDGTEAQFAALHAKVQATSPNFYNITRPIPTNSTLVMERGPTTN